MSSVNWLFVFITIHLQFFAFHSSSCVGSLSLFPFLSESETFLLQSRTCAFNGCALMKNARMFKITSFQRTHSIFTGLVKFLVFRATFIFVEKCIEIIAFSIKFIAFGKPLFLWYSALVHYAYVFDQVILTSTEWIKWRVPYFWNSFWIVQIKRKTEHWNDSTFSCCGLNEWYDSAKWFVKREKNHINSRFDIRLEVGWKHFWLDRSIIIFIVQCFSIGRLQFVE